MLQSGINTPDATPLPDPPPNRECPSCGSPLRPVLDDRRCPGCGCDPSLLPGDVLSDDVSPYARGGRYWSMVRWVVPAGNFRLSHLSRMRRSRWSVRFANRSLLLLGLAWAVVMFPHWGWKRTIDRGSGTIESVSPPASQGWLLVKRAPSPQQFTSGNPILVRLYWNPAVLISGLVVNFWTGFGLGWWMLAWIRRGSQRALGPPYQGQPRFAAALHYSSAHAFILLMAAALYGSSVLLDWARVYSWTAQWSGWFHVVSAVGVGMVGLFLWWFWLLRMAHTAPPEAIDGVSWYFAIKAPLVFVVLFGGWFAIQWYGVPPLANLLHWTL